MTVSPTAKAAGGDGPNRPRPDALEPGGGCGGREADRGRGEAKYWHDLEGSSM